MKYRLNAYFACLLITIAGAGAALIITRVAYSSFITVQIIGAGQYAELERQVLKTP